MIIVVVLTAILVALPSTYSKETNEKFKSPCLDDSPLVDGVRIEIAGEEDYHKDELLKYQSLEIMSRLFSRACFSVLHAVNHMVHSHTFSDNAFPRWIAPKCSIFILPQTRIDSESTNRTI